MEFSEHERDPGKKLSGFGIVILLHVVVIYALGLGRTTPMVPATQNNVSIFVELRDLA